VLSVLGWGILAGAAAVGCTASGNGATTSTTRVPLPAGPTPSAISRMVCSPKAQQELATPLGVTATVTTPTWVDHTYFCRYSYTTGFFTLSVKELSSWAETRGYFDMLGTRLGDTAKVTGLGQGAFATTNGSIVVRKDWKVLVVDVSGLPAQFGVPPTSSSDVAYTVADVIMGCWNGD
jgi:hypothetical protein